MDRKPLFYSISPIKLIIEEREQFNALSEIEKYSNIAVPEIYLGNSTGALNETLKIFLKNNKNYDGPLIISINSHSIDSGKVYTGKFIDHEFKEQFVFDPIKLWSGYLYLDGLEKLIKEYWKGKPVYIVYVHCTGNSKLFLENLKNEIKKECPTQPIPSNVSFVALEGSIENDVSRQVQLCKWINSKFKNAQKSIIEPIQSPTIATKLQISNNPQYSSIFRNEMDLQNNKTHSCSELTNEQINSYTF
ncbi:hypothetical protein RB653_003401 [Dictyostelium firmibasis]|uniref:Uncharacterized protein n=1 Tax=Dictyostelium firmibasis TaxID=79012 RepID=A0AAN7UHD6_9MYCE